VSIIVETVGHDSFTHAGLGRRGISAGFNGSGMVIVTFIRSSGFYTKTQISDTGNEINIGEHGFHTGDSEGYGKLKREGNFGLHS
jgi:hypothetical protein